MEIQFLGGNIFLVSNKFVELLNRGITESQYCSIALIGLFVKTWGLGGKYD